MLLKPAIAFSALAFAGTSLASERPRVLNVCDLMRRADQLEGRIVRVQGVLQNSDTLENPFFDELVGDDCKGAKEGKVKVQVVSPDSHFLANPPVGYKPDMDSISRVEPLFEKAAANHRSVFATVEGVFYISHQRTSSPARHRGYPAFIVIQALRSVRER